MLIWNATAQGFGGRPRTAHAIDPCWPATGRPSAYAVPVMTPSPGPIYGTRLPSPYVRDYAAPTPAPPSATPIEPGPAAPRVIESRSTGETAAHPQAARKDYEAFYLAPAALAPARATDALARTVSFWNFSERNVSLQIEGRTYSLARGRQLTLSLPVKFQWRIGQRDPVSLEVPAGRSGVEIVIRR